MIAVQVSVDNRQLFLKLKRGEKALAYGVARGLNETAKVIQQGERDHLARVFHLRTANSRRFLNMMVALITKDAWAQPKAGKAFVDIIVGKGERLLLSDYEAGAPRLPFVGKSVAVPFIGHAARPAIARPVPQKLHVQRLDLHREAGRWVGKERTYVIPSQGIYQRRGRKGARGLMLYSFRKGLKLRPVLRFVQTAKRLAQYWMNKKMEEALRIEMQRRLTQR